VQLSAAVAIAVLSAAVVLAGCSKAQPKDITASQSRSTSAAPTTSSPAPSRSASARPSPTRTKPASFNGTCDDLLPLSLISDALQRPVIGQTAFIVGVAEPNIGRLAYLNCRYGVATTSVKGKKVTDTKVELGVSLYKSNQQANSRVRGTIEDYRAHGASETAAALGQFSGATLVGYGKPTLVVAAGPRTVAITASASLLGRSPGKALAAVATAVLDATKDFSDGGVASTSVTPSPTSTS
jgi:hypothetical protein